MEQLKLPPVFQVINSTIRGVDSDNGATGSGKSTTMAAMIGYINKEY